MIDFDAVSIIGALVGVAAAYWYAQDPSVHRPVTLIVIGTLVGVLTGLGWYWGRWRTLHSLPKPSLATGMAFLAAAALVTIASPPVQVVGIAFCGGWLIARAFQPKQDHQDGDSHASGES